MFCDFVSTLLPLHFPLGPETDLFSTVIAVIILFDRQLVIGCFSRELAAILYTAYDTFVEIGFAERASV